MTTDADEIQQLDLAAMAAAWTDAHAGYDAAGASPWLAHEQRDVVARLAASWTAARVPAAAAESVLDESAAAAPTEGSAP